MSNSIYGQSATSPILNGRSDRIEIRVMAPQLNMQFDLNQSANGQTRLLLTLINTKLRSLLSPQQTISKVTHKGEEVSPNKSYLEIGIVDQSVITVEIRNEDSGVSNISETSNSIETILEKLVLIFKEEGFQQCITEYKSKYMSEEYGGLLIDSLRKRLSFDASAEYDVVTSLISLLDQVYTNPSNEQEAMILKIVQWLHHISQQSTTTQWHSVVLPSILHYLEVYKTHPLCCQFLQLLSVLVSCPPSETKELLNTTYFLPLLLQLASTANCPLQALFHILEAWSSWDLPVYSQLSTEEIAKKLSVLIDTVQWNATYLRQFLHLITVLFNSDDHIFIFLKSGLFPSLITSARCHDSAIILVLVQFFNKLVHSSGFHHIFFVMDVITICKNQVDLFPRNIELTKEVHTLIQSLAEEECECIYLVQKQIFSVFNTTFLALNDNLDILLSSIDTISHLCSKSNYVIDRLTEEPLLTDILYLTRNHPFNEQLWTSIISLLRMVNRTSSGHAFVSSKTVINELNGCRLLLGENSEVTKESRCLLNDVNKKVRPCHEKTILNPVLPLKHSHIIIEIEIKHELTDAWFITYYGKEIDLISFLLHGLLLPSVGSYSQYFFSALCSLINETSAPYLMSFIDLSDVVPCVSHTLLRFIDNSEMIQQGISLLSLFSTYPMYTVSFLYDETIALLIEIATNYPHSQSFLLPTLDLLILLSKQQNVHVRLKKSGIIRMIGCLNEIYDSNQMNDLSLQEVSRMIISRNDPNQDVNSTPNVFIIQKTRVLEVNLGLRNVSGESGDSGIEKFWMERLIDQLLNTDRNTQLLLIDQFIELFNSEYQRLITYFLKSMGVLSVVKLAFNNLNDKEIISKSMNLLSIISQQNNYKSYVDLNAVTALCIHVLKEYKDTISCVLPSLVLLGNHHSKESLERMNNDCYVFHDLLKSNEKKGEICEYLFCILRRLCDTSHLFRIQFIQSNIIQDLCRCFLHHSGRSTILYDFCSLLVSISDETEFDNNPNRFMIIDILLKLISSDYTDDVPYMNAILSSLQCITCVSYTCISHFMKKQGLVSLASIMEVFKDCLPIATTCCNFVYNIVIQINISKEILSTNIILHLFHILQCHLDVPVSDLIACFRCLRSISCLSIDCIKGIYNAGGIHHLADYLKKRPYVPSVLKEIMLCLYQCTMLVDVFSEKDRDEIVASLKRIDISFPPEDDYSIKYDLLLQALSSLSFSEELSGDNVNQEKLPVDFTSILNSPVVVALNSLLDIKNCTDSELIINLKRLETLCSSTLNKEELTQYGLEPILFDILNQYASNESVVSLCFSILLYLKHTDITPQYWHIISKCLQSDEVHKSIDCILCILQFLVSISYKSTVHSSFIPSLIEACSDVLRAEGSENLQSSNILANRDRTENTEFLNLMKKEFPIVLSSSHASSTLSPQYLYNNAKGHAVIDTLITFLLEQSFIQLFSDFSGFRTFFLQHKHYICESYLLLLKADVLCRRITNRPLLIKNQEEYEDGIVVDVSLVDYLIAVIAQLSEHEDDSLKIYNIIQLISYVDEYKLEFIKKNGIILFLEFYTKYNNLNQFSSFSSCLVSLLLEGIDSNVIRAIIALCNSVLEKSYSKPIIIAVFSIFNQLCACNYMLVDTIHIQTISQKIELLNNTVDEVSIVFSLLSSLLHQYTNPTILEEIVVMLFNAVFKGHQYYFLVEKVNKLFEEYKNNSFVFDLFDKFIPDAYQNALLAAINGKEPLDPVCDLICAYLLNEQKCQNMVDYGLIELLHTQLPNILSKNKGIAIIKILNTLIQFNYPRTVLSEDRELFNDIRTWLLQMSPSPEEKNVQFFSVYDFFINGNYSQQTYSTSYVNPLSYDFGQPPEYEPCLDS